MTTAHISLMLQVVLALRLSKGYSNKAVSRISSRVVNRHNINIPPKHKTCQVFRNPILYFIYLSFHCSSLRCFLAGTSRLCCSQGIEIKTEVSVGMPQNLLIRYIHLSSEHPSLSFLCRHIASHRSTTERKHVKTEVKSEVKVMVETSIIAGFCRLCINIEQWCT